MNTLKEQDGRYYQECEVVMLATEKVTNIIYRKNDDILIKKHTGNSALTETDKDFRNIYVTSNEEIKEGDWFISAGKIHQYKGDKLPLIVRCDFRKIIATTDETLYLTFNNGKTDLKFVLPKPSDSFISKYIEEYNKGNIISDVLVEYKLNQYKFMSTLCTTKEKEYELKVDSNNTITIKKVKDSYSREEVFILLNELSAYLEKEGACIYPTQVLHEITQTFIKNNI